MTLEITLPSIEIILAAIIIVAAILIFYKLYLSVARFFRRPDLYGLERKEIRKRWQGIEKLLWDKEEMKWRTAVIEADKLLDQVLKSMTLPGKDLGERLRLAVAKYPQLRQVWWAHKVRNQLVHESDFVLNYRLAKAAVLTFKAGLRDLGVL